MMKIFTKTFLGLLAAASFTTAQAQWQITAPNTPQTIDFSTYTGAGFSPSPAAGELDSDTWSVLGLDAGPLLFGGTANTPATDFTRGTSPGGVTTGGLYAFDTGGNIIFGVQPTGTDYTPGHTLLKIENNTGAVIKDLMVSYDFFYQNNADRANSWNLSYSTTDTASANFISTAVGDTTPGLLSATAAWTSVANSTTLMNLNIPANGVIYLRWSSNDVSGAGSRDEMGMDNITLTAISPLFADFSATTACEGDTTMFTDSSVSNNGNIVSWVWSFGDTNTAYVQNPWHIYDMAGTYTVQLIVTNANNDVDTAMMQVMVGGIPVAGFSSDVTSGCSPLCVMFMDTTDMSGPGTLNAWMWDFGDGGPMSTVMNPTHCYQTAGTYDVTLTVWTNLGCSDTVIMPNYITVNQSPVASFNETVTGSSYSGTSTSTGTITSYAWDMGEGTMYSTPVVSHNYPVDGTYTVCLTVTDVNGCMDMECDTVNIITTGTEELMLGNVLAIYPNPTANGIVTVDFGKYSGKDVKISVYNIIGKAVYERQIISNNLEKQAINLQDLPSGNYFINIMAGKETFTKRITINR